MTKKRSDAELEQRGRDAEEFFRSDLGIFYLELATEQIQTAEDEFKECDPNDSVVVAGIQRRINIPIQALNWVYDIINKGNDVKQTEDVEDELKKEYDTREFDERPLY